MQIILLEKVDHVGSLGEEVRVKDGYARNYLLPKGKALRATDANRAYFQREKAAIEAANNSRREAAAKEASKLKNLELVIIRQASEAGQLYGSVSARDVADAVSEAANTTVERSQVVINDSFKTLGIFKVEIALHAEVKEVITLNVARTPDEAAVQKKTGKALIRNAAFEEENSSAEALVKAESDFEEATSESAEKAAEESAE